MNDVKLESKKAIEAVDALIAHLERVLEALDDLNLKRAAIDINGAIIQLTSVRDSLEDALDSTGISPADTARIKRISKGLSLPNFSHFG